LYREQKFKLRQYKSFLFLFFKKEILPSYFVKGGATMTTALNYLALTLVLAMVQVGLTAACKRRQDGTQWAVGTRDNEHPGYTGVAPRMVRAQANLYESLPIFIGAVLLVHITGHEGALATWGAAIFFWARLAFIPAYAYGLVPWRTLVWFAGVVGLVMVLVSLI
jgi:uncharacterized MAPEG superfamily protein